MTRTKRNSAKNRAEIYGFSEFLDFPERVQRQICTIYVEKSWILLLMEFKHPETYFNKLKLRIKLVKILCEKFCVFIFVYIPANRLYLSAWNLASPKHRPLSKETRSYRSSLLIVQINATQFYISSLCTDVTLDEARERTSVGWMKIPCSGRVDFPQICGKASDWPTVLYLNNI
jgi:hypothetical protein